MNGQFSLHTMLVSMTVHNQPKHSVTSLRILLWPRPPKWTLPMIFWVPTPLAMPAQRRSTSLMILQRSAQAWLMMVIWAPETWETVSLHQAGKQPNGRRIQTMTKVSFLGWWFTWVDKSLHRMPVDFAIDVEHNHLTKAFRRFLHGDGHVLFYIVLPGICKCKRSTV